MRRRLALVHTVGSLAEQFEELTSELMPSVETVSVVREALLQRTIDEGRLAPATSEELAQTVCAMRDVDAVLVTCSSLGPAVEAARERADVPVLRVDEPMARVAVQVGGRVGVVATLPTTLGPTVDLVRRVAAEEGRSVEVLAQLCEGAFEAAQAGDGERHDELVREGLTAVLGEVDVVVLAQASMARVVHTLAEAPTVPVLSSPRLAIEHAAALLEAGIRGTQRR